MVSTTTDPQAAPEGLELVRELLNTWLIPNDTREPAEQFDAYCRRHRLGPAEAVELRALRDDLRAVVEGRLDGDQALTTWIERLGIRVVVESGAVRFRASGRSNAASQALVTVLDSIGAGSWPRLKACPDCRWVFYDHTRSGTKRWCLMNATGANGRGCGNIAKSRRRRARQRAAAASV